MDRTEWCLGVDEVNGNCGSPWRLLLLAESVHVTHPVTALTNPRQWQARWVPTRRNPQTAGVRNSRDSDLPPQPVEISIHRQPDPTIHAEIRQDVSSIVMPSHSFAK